MKARQHNKLEHFEDETEIKTSIEQKFLEDLKNIEKENEILKSCLESVSAHEKKMYDQSLRIANNITQRDSKAVANIILNMGFGNRNNISFCTIFELRENVGCGNHNSCTDCIHSWLKSYFTKSKD